MSNRPCPLCSSNSAETFIRSAADDALTANDLSYAYDIKKYPYVVKCLSCGLLYVPRVPDNIVDLYKKVQDSEYHQTSTFRQETFQGFLNAKEKYAPMKGSLLDVGCSTGLFMEVARNAGYAVQGLEPNDWARKICERKNLPVFDGELKDLDLRKKYDCITMWDVIEHVIDPVALLAHAWEHLNKGGCILMATPDTESLLMRVLRKYHWLFAPWHLTYFDSRTMVRLIETLDKPEYVITTAPPYKAYFFKSLEKLSRIPLLGKVMDLASKIPETCDFPVKLKAAMLIVVFKQK
jgi:SAM-dependent methyltransferase